MDTPMVTMGVRNDVDTKVAVIDLTGEVTSACEPVLMSPYEQACEQGVEWMSSTSPDSCT